MAEGYFVIGCDADGTTFDGPLSREELERALAEEEYGEVESFALSNPGTDGFCISLGDGQLLVIRGEIVVPKPKETVTAWSLP